MLIPKALTLWQPWASLMAFELKRIETRSWQTNYRGPLAIHAARRAPIPYTSLFPESTAAHVRQVLGPYESLPTGCIVAVGNLGDVRPTLAFYAPELPRTPEFLFFGDFTPGRFAWVFSAMRRVRPWFCRGGQGLWVPQLTDQQVEDMLAAPLSP